MAPTSRREDDDELSSSGSASRSFSFSTLQPNAAAVPRATALRRCESEPAACWATDRTESSEMEAALPSPSEQQRSDQLNATCSTAPPALRQTKTRAKRSYQTAPDKSHSQ